MCMMSASASVCVRNNCMFYIRKESARTREIVALQTRQRGHTNIYAHAETETNIYNKWRWISGTHI